MYQLCLVEFDSVLWELSHCKRHDNVCKLGLLFRNCKIRASLGIPIIRLYVVWEDLL
jgi:hypothetical protein